MLTFQNYHRHSHYSNVRVSDSVIFNEDYAKRAVELGHGIISTMEHGWAGRYIEGYELAQKYDLKFVFGAEAYWVKDRTEKDRSNCHIYLGARNENGRRAINDILSESSLTGFYAQPRVDIPLILSLPADDVIVTTACVAYWKYDDADDITKRFQDHFGKNFYLEVQYHNTEKQRELNRHILQLSKESNIPIIMGCDSHYIYPEQPVERNDFLAAKEMKYDDEAGWFMDYPDGDTAYKRFADQCVLSHEQILEAMNNTNVFLQVEPYDCPCFNHEVKMPTIYPKLSQAERDKKYDDLVWDAWAAEKKNIAPVLWPHYEEEIRKEVDIVHQTFHADYFLLDHAIIKHGKEMGGVMTSTGRGSSVSFYTNKLLGLTDVDRISAKVKMYPERFMSPTRILEAHVLADVDMNMATVDIFAQAQEDVVGKGHSYPMIAYGTMKPKAAWKMYAKSQNVEFSIANAVSDQITKYEIALKHSTEDSADDIDILDYIEPEYQEIYKQSGNYLGVVVSASIHPCSYLLYQGDIRREIGLTRAKDKVVCVMDGHWAEDYKFLKNDLLKVSCIDLIDKVYKRIGKPRNSIRELLEMCPKDSNVWDIYKKGCTLGINQCEQDNTRHKAQKYAPHNISELCAFVAAIRPGFKSMYKVFEDRKPFSYHIKSLDSLIQTEEMPNSFILYQEMSMAVLNYAGIPMSECYEIIKNIAKKRVEKVLVYKEKFITNFEKVLIENEGQTSDKAKETAAKIWQVLEDSSRYSFNASHAYCVALDSLYGAYLKTNYPVEFYETFLRILEEKGDKERMALVKDEAESYFNIVFPPYKFGQDNRQVLGNSATKEITNTIQAIKGFGGEIGNILYECGKVEHRDFIDVMLWLGAHSIKSSKVIPLIQIGYFEQFGNIPTLLAINEAFDYFKQGQAKIIPKDNPYPDLMSQFATDKNAKGEILKRWTLTDCLGLLHHYASTISLEDISYKDKAQYQLDNLGYVDLTTGKHEDRRKVIITNLFKLISKDSGEPWAYRLAIKSIGTGKSSIVTLYAKTYNFDPVEKGDIIYITSVKKNDKGFWMLYDYDKLEGTA